jgi:hypothetical protein
MLIRRIAQMTSGPNGGPKDREATGSVSRKKKFDIFFPFPICGGSSRCSAKATGKEGREKRLHYFQKGSLP